ncbi:hypothetical protein PG984_016467 [Apiospora sp. TS-2023a]
MTGNPRDERRDFHHSSLGLVYYSATGPASVTLRSFLMTTFQLGTEAEMDLEFFENKYKENLVIQTELLGASAAGHDDSEDEDKDAGIDNTFYH